MSIVQTRQTDRWYHLLAISCNKRGIELGGGGVPYWSGVMQYIWLVQCKIQPVNGNEAVRLGLTIELYGTTSPICGPL